jgi:hypothetical protein
MRHRCLHHSLLRVVRRIREYSRIKSSNNSIKALNYHAMPVCDNEVAIQYNFPLCMEHLTPAVSEEGFGRASASNVGADKILKVIRQLRHPHQRYKKVSRRVLGLTDSKYAMWLQRFNEGMERLYLDSLPKNMYTGHSFVFPKDVRRVSSDQNMRATMQRGSRQPGSPGLSCKT